MFMKDFTRLSDLVTAVMPAAATGMAAGTLVETATGWRAVETLRMGDRVQTLDGGLARVVAMARQNVADGRLVHVPGGTLGNCQDLWLAPFQHLAIDTLGDPALPDVSVVLVPAAALEGTAGTLRRAPDRAETVSLLFAEDEVVWANSGALVWCPGVAQDPADLPASAFFTRLSAAEARRFLARRFG